jgi:signal transduction histidine kinase
MLREGNPIGVISVTGAEPAMFSQRQIAMLQTFADQAVIAIENTRLFNELQERLEQQTATSEILRVISQSQSDVQPVFETIAINARKLCEATFAVVFRFDGVLINTAAADSASPEALKAIGQDFPMPPSRGSSTGRAILIRAVSYVPDVRQDAEYRLQSVAEAAGFRSILSVPMLRDGSPIGTITVTGAEPAMFSERQIAMLQTFADQAVIAIENTRLFTELQTRTAELGRSVEELKALSEVGTAVSSTLDVDTVLTTILTHANQLAGTQAGQIYDYDEATEELRPRATFGYSQDIADALRRNPIKKGEGVAGKAVATRQPVQVPDIAAEGAYDARLRDLITGSGFRALLAVPLIREEQVMGALAIARTQPGEFRRQVVDLMTTFASQSALAMQNARLFHQLEIASHHKSQFLANMSHELRTPLNAILGYTELIVDQIYGEVPEKIKEVLDQVQKSGRHLLGLINDVLDLSKIEAGQLTLELSSYAFSDVVQGVVSAVGSLAAEKQLRLTADVAPDLPVGQGDQRRITQVLLNLVGNAIKFTDEGEVAMRVSTRDGTFLAAVADTGPGIRPEDQGKIFEEFQQSDTAVTKSKSGTGLGLAIAKRIVELHGGCIWVESVLDKGSTFFVSLPIKAERKEVATHT